MKTIIAAVLSLAVIAAAAPVTFAADAAGACGKGKVFDPDTQKCVKKPKGSGSNAG
jgi:hypothetical protein